jgi:hemerythrin-like domain-containing protein
MDAITLLRADHQEVLGMLDTLDSGLTEPGGGGNERLRARKELVTELVIAESRHEAVEEQFFWPMVRDRVPGGEELAAHAVGQEDDAKQVLNALDHADPNTAEFEELVNRIIADGREHIGYEQDEVWPKVQAAVSPAELAELGEKMAKAKKTAPTRPHPATPSSAGAQKSAGPVVAMTDKLRDAVSGRGRHE